MKPYRLTWITLDGSTRHEDFDDLEQAAEYGRAVRLDAYRPGREVEIIATSPRPGRTRLWEVDKAGRLAPLELEPLPRMRAGLEGAGADAFARSSR